jgi:hypothetical protein
VLPQLAVELWARAPLSLLLLTSIMLLLLLL